MFPSLPENPASNMDVQMPLALKAKNRNKLENCSYLAICPGQMFDISKSKTSKRKATLQHTYCHGII